MEQVHKRFTDQEVRELLARYVTGEIERKYIQEILGIKKRSLFLCDFRACGERYGLFRSKGNQ